MIKIKYPEGWQDVVEILIAVWLIFSPSLAFRLDLKETVSAKQIWKFNPKISENKMRHFLYIVSPPLCYI